jgi:predicted small lipoprotein YifL
VTGRAGRLLALCLALASLAACGVRGDPVPPSAPERATPAAATG